MLSIGIAILAIAVSLIGIIQLCATDPKRLRAHRKASQDRTTLDARQIGRVPGRDRSGERRRLAIFLLIGPALLQLQALQFGAFLLWLGALPVLAWLIILYWEALEPWLNRRIPAIIRREGKTSS